MYYVVDTTNQSYEAIDLTICYYYYIIEHEAHNLFYYAQNTKYLLSEPQRKVGLPSEGNKRIIRIVITWT